MFNIDFFYLIRSNLPTRLRKPKIISFLNLALSIIRRLFDEFIELRQYYFYDINFTGQVIYLEKKLSDYLNCIVLIEDGGFIPPVYMFNKSEDFQPIYMLNNFVSGYIYTAAEEVLFENSIYIYSTEGSGTSPDLDSAASFYSNVHEFMLSNNLELSSLTDFVVKIPVIVFDNLTLSEIAKIKAIVDFYRLFNKTFNIISY